MPNKKPKSLTAQQCQLLLDYLKDPPQYSGPPRRIHRDYTMALLMLDTGIRVGELVKLKVKHLIFAGHFVSQLTITEDIAKTHAERTIPMSDRLQHSIRDMHGYYWRHEDHRPTTFAFYTTSPSRSLTTRQVQRLIKNAADLVLNAKVTPHILRHTFATRLLEKTNTRVVQEALGHKSLTSTQIYTHVSQAQLKTGIELMVKE